MEKSKQKPPYREGTPQIESVSREPVLPKFAPEQFLEPPSGGGSYWSASRPGQ
ncbi:hypothetical protein [Paenibacillus macerans]|uniref:hypothetical protein n=1 Tax=Paenibacillus macerans TaxID=44252 RepID=UPI003D322C90